MRCYTYILYCTGGSFYTGWTNDLIKRFKTHNSGAGSKYTRAKLPVYMMYYEEFDNKSDAMRRECEIKQLSHKEKLDLILNNMRSKYNIPNDVNMQLHILTHFNHEINGVQYVTEDEKLNYCMCMNPDCPFGGTYVDDLTSTDVKRILVR